jgi:hypothetical protein
MTYELVKRIAPLFGQAPEAACNATTNTYKVYGQVHTLLFGHTLKKSYLSRQRYPQVCPRCLEEKGYAQLAWDITCYTACTEHELTLIDHCPACKKRLSWSRESLFDCKCGQSLVEASTSEPTAHESQILVGKIIKQKLFSTEIYQYEYSYLFNLFNKLSLDITLRLIWSFGLQNDTPPSQKSWSKAIPSSQVAAELIKHSIARIEQAIKPLSSIHKPIQINQLGINEVLQDANDKEFHVIHQLLEKVFAFETNARIKSANALNQLSLFSQQ